MKRLLTAIVVVALAAGLAGLGHLILDGSSSDQARLPSTAPGASSTAGGGSAPGSQPSATSSGGPQESASLPPVDSPLADVPIVPVAQFRTTAESVTRADIAATLAGTSTTWDALELVDSEADAVLAGLGVEAPASGGHLVLAANAAKVSADLAAHRKHLAVLRADAVGPAVRALGWGGHALFGVDAVKTVATWGLTARLPQRSDTPVWDPGGSFTIVAGGDIMLDRGVAQTLKINGSSAT